MASVSRHRPTLFLDVDGVLNHTEWYLRMKGEDRLPEGPADDLDPDCIERVEALVKDMDAQVVVSSTWRMGGWDNSRLSTLVEACPFELVDLTPVYHDKPRGHEVRAWRRKNKHEGPFMCLDDDGDLEPYLGHLCMVGHRWGFQEVDLRRAQVLWNSHLKRGSKVPNRLPLGSVLGYTCPECQKRLILRESRYGVFWGCENWPGCDGSTSAHQETGKNMGLPAVKAVKQLRQVAHSAFDRLWADDKQLRYVAYGWLREVMGIHSPEYCHISWFDDAQCREVIKLCQPMSPDKMRAWGRENNYAC